MPNTIKCSYDDAKKTAEILEFLGLVVNLFFECLHDCLARWSLHCIMSTVDGCILINILCCLIYLFKIFSGTQ